MSQSSHRGERTGRCAQDAARGTGGVLAVSHAPALESSNSTTIPLVALGTRAPCAARPRRVSRRLSHAKRAAQRVARTPWRSTPCFRTISLSAMPTQRRSFCDRMPYLSTRVRSVCATQDSHTTSHPAPLPCLPYKPQAVRVTLHIPSMDATNSTPYITTTCGWRFTYLISQDTVLATCAFVPTEVQNLSGEAQPNVRTSLPESEVESCRRHRARCLSLQASSSLSTS